MNNKKLLYEENIPHGYRVTASSYSQKHSGYWPTPCISGRKPRMPSKEQSDADVIFPVAKGEIADTSISLSLPVFPMNLITLLNIFHSHALW